jgi:hypothetical protein
MLLFAICLSPNCLFFFFSFLFIFYFFFLVSGKQLQLPNGTVSDTRSKFDDKIEPSSSKMYFHYYGQLLHQQNMLQDYVRTGYIT